MKFYSIEKLKQATRETLLKVMKEHGYENYEKFSTEEIIDILSRIEA